MISIWWILLARIYINLSQTFQKLEEEKILPDLFYKANIADAKHRNRQYNYL